MHIGQRIKELVEVKKYTNRAFADKMGMSENNLYKIFRKPNIDTDLLLKISQILGVSMSYWFSEEKGNTYHAENFSQAGHNNKQKNLPNDEPLIKDLEMCRKEVEGLKRELAAKDKIIELLERK